MPRKAVTLEELYNILHTTFSLERSRDCRTCATPIPVRRTPADTVSANWFITEPNECAHGCNSLLAEVATHLMSEYELERSVPVNKRR